MIDHNIGVNMEKHPETRNKLDPLFEQKGHTRYKWIDPGKIIVSRWVRMKCMFGCSAYGKIASCPPNVPSVDECEKFFKEYSLGVIFHFPVQLDDPDKRHQWSKTVNMKLYKLEREVFLSGFERAFLLYMDSCSICKECSGERETCKEPGISRPSPEGLGMDVYATVRQFGFPIAVRTDYQQEMNRYAFLLVR